MKRLLPSFKRLSLNEEQRVSLKFGRFVGQGIITIVVVMIAFNLMNQSSTIDFFLGVALLIIGAMYYIPKVIRLIKNLMWAWRGR
jgi:hypothetical protein